MFSKPLEQAFLGYRHIETGADEDLDWALEYLQPADDGRDDHSPRQMPSSTGKPASRILPTRRPPWERASTRTAKSR